MRLLAAFVVFLLFAAPALADGAIPPSEAASHVGETVTVQGTVNRVYTSRSGAVFVDMGGQYPDNPFTGFIPPDNAPTFPNIGAIEGEEVGITGKISLYKGRPEIILNSTDQIETK
jgi:hypothetical protein